MFVKEEQEVKHPKLYIILEIWALQMLGQMFLFNDTRTQINHTCDRPPLAKFCVYLDVHEEPPPQH